MARLAFCPSRYELETLKTPEQILKDAFSQERVTLICGKHNYAGGKHQKPRFGCKDCAQVQLMYIMAQYKGDKMELLDMLEETIREACELVDKGQFDYQQTKPEITIDKDAA